MPFNCPSDNTGDDTGEKMPGADTLNKHGLLSACMA